MQALRDNSEKPDLHYLHTWYHALCEVCMVCQAGAKKYARGNYLKGQPHSQLLACAERHIGKFGNYKEDDYDTGEKGTDRHHIALAIWNLLQLLENDLDVTAKAKWDDRLRAPEDTIDGTKQEERNIPFSARSEDCLEAIARQGKIHLREDKDSIPEKEECVYTGLPVTERNHSGSKRTLRGSGSNETSCCKGTES
jgi:hypothetical protein